MFEVKNFDDWIEDRESGKFGSGASEKVWLINPETGEKGLFKFPKVKDKEKGILTGEYWAEKLASEIGKLIDVDCAKVDIGIYKGRIGSMSYNIIKDNDTIFREGLDYIQAQYPFYNKENLVDEYNNKKYSLQMIESSVSGLLEISEILKIIIFDCLIGNSDRHHSNWGVISYVKKVDNGNRVCLRLCPLYDNGSSLCAYEANNIEVFFKDKMKFEALVNTKSKSAIGWENERPIKHFDLLKKIKNNKYEETIPYIEKIKNNVNEKSIEKILNEFDNNVINEQMKRLLKIFILERRKRMLEIYDFENEV